jgi:hypothetical protein
VDASRIRATFTEKIAPGALSDYVFLVHLEQIKDDAKASREVFPPVQVALHRGRAFSVPRAGLGRSADAIDVQKKIEVQSSTLGCCGPKNKLKRNGIKLRDRVGFEAAYDL